MDKKKEYLYMHGLLAEISSYTNEEYGLEQDLNQYKELGIGPTAIHKSKTDHKKAVQELVEFITSAIESREQEKALPRF